LLWLAVNTDAGFHQLPHGWSTGKLGDVARIECEGRMEEMRAALDNAFWGEPGRFAGWLTAALNQNRPVFERAAIGTDLEELQEFFKHQTRPKQEAAQLVLL